MEGYEFTEGQLGRTIFLRIGANSDFVNSVKGAFEKSGFLVGVISVAIGSFKEIHFTFVNASGKYSAPVRKKGRFELVQAGGFLSHISGSIETHIHASFAGNDGKLFGGHLLDEGNIVYATAEVRIDEVLNVKIAKMSDLTTGFQIFKIVS